MSSDLKQHKDMVEMASDSVKDRFGNQRMQFTGNASFRSGGENAHKEDFMDNNKSNSSKLMRSARHT